MFGEKAQAIAKKFEPLKSVLDFTSYIVGSFAVFGITGAVVMTWFSEQLATLGYQGVIAYWLVLCVWILIAIRLVRGLFHSWRGMVGLALIAVSILLCMIGVFLVARDKSPPAVIANPAGQQSDVIPNRFYSSTDKEEISRVFERISMILNKPAAAIESESQRLAQIWESKKYNSTNPSEQLKYLLERLEALRPVSSEVYQGIRDLMNDFPRRKELIAEILQLSNTEREQPIPNWQYASNDLHRAVSTYAEIFDKIDARAREGFVVTANPVQTNFMNATAKLNGWIHQSNLRLVAREKEIFQ